MYDLGEFFKPDFELAKTSVTSVFKGDLYRITVFSDILIRFEYSPTGNFEDRPTERVVCRNFKSPLCQGKVVNGVLLIDTPIVQVEYGVNKPFSGSKIIPGNNLRVTMKGTEKWWYYGNPEARNFGGTSVSLEDLKLGTGLFSPDGFAVIDDSEGKAVDEGGALVEREAGAIDVYLFMYNEDFGRALKDYYRLTGMPPMIPKYALGTWYSKENMVTSDSVIDTVNKFSDHGIPLAVLYLNNFWHSDNQSQTGFTWHKERFANPKQMIDYVHAKGVRLGLAIDPTSGIGAGEEFYSKAAGYLGVGNNQTIPFNVLDPKWVDVYFKLFIHPLEAIGVDFIINDYKNIKDVNTLNMLNYYHYKDHNRSDYRRGLIMARNGLKSAHRNLIHYTGNIEVGWEKLAILPRFNYSAANLGMSWISNDIAGYEGGIEDAELYRRYVQFGCFSPILRFNSAKSKYYKRQPWQWDIKTYTVAKEYLLLRQRLISYIYSEAYKYHKYGRPLIQPLYYQDLSLYDSSLYANQYMFGTELLIAPITIPSDELIGRTIQRFFLPTGTWYDFMTGKRFLGDRNYMAFVKDEDYPVFARAGAIIPMAINEDINSLNNPEGLEIHIFPGDNNIYELYEDDGISNQYLKNICAITQIDFKYQPNNFKIEMKPSQGHLKIIPTQRQYVIKLHNTKATAEIEVKIQGKSIPFNVYQEGNNCVIDIESVPTVMPLVITCVGEDIEISALRLINDDIDDILQDLHIETTLKDELSAIIFSKEEIKKKRIAVRKLKRKGLDGRSMNMFLRLLEYVELA